MALQSSSSLRSPPPRRAKALIPGSEGHQGTSREGSKRRGVTRKCCKGPEKGLCFVGQTPCISCILAYTKGTTFSDVADRLVYACSACIEIPYVTEQGIFGGLTGNFFQRTGNSHARTGNSSSDQFFEPTTSAPGSTASRST